MLCFDEVNKVPQEVNIVAPKQDAIISIEIFFFMISVY